MTEIGKQKTGQKSLILSPKQESLIMLPLEQILSDAAIVFLLDSFNLNTF